MNGKAVSGPPAPDLHELAFVRACTAAHGGGFYLGSAPDGPVVAPPEHAVLVLGPPRSGKTTSLIVPNVLAATGGVLVASTKPDVLEATVAARSMAGPCSLFDPSGSTPVPSGVERVGWSPLGSSQDYGEAMETAWAMVMAARPDGDRGEAVHWNRRAQQLLACLFHAAATAGDPFSSVLSALGTHQADRALEVLESLADDAPFLALSDVTRTDSREQSGIWSTASSVCHGYLSPGARQVAELAPLDHRQLTEAGGTLYVVAPSARQQESAAIVTGMVHDLRNAVYRANRHGAVPALGAARPEPVRFVLDELANIAPMHDLPELLSEGASQGVLTLACLQDLSQARDRWGVRAGGFLTLFGSKVVLPGVADTRTLQDLSLLAGDRRVMTVSTSRSAGRGGWWRRGDSESRTASWRWKRVLEPSDIAAGRPGEAVHFAGAQVGRVTLTPYHRCSPWREAAMGSPALEPTPPSAARDQPGRRGGRGTGRAVGR